MQYYFYHYFYYLFIIFILMGGIQYYAMIRMGGGGFVLPMQKSEGVLSGGFCPRGFCPRGFCPEGVCPTFKITTCTGNFSCKTTFFKIDPSARKLQESGNKQNKIKEN